MGVELILNIALNIRKMEIVGFVFSIVALMVAFFIYTHFRALHNHRTRIHKNIFTAVIIQIIIQLTIYIDQAIVRDNELYLNVNVTRGIDNTEYLCETCYVLLEYTITSMFNWMLVEGMFLHKLVTDYVLRGSPSYLLYYFLGWGLPAIVTAIWTTLTALHYRNDTINRCWYGYNFTKLYWILQGSRLAVIVINFAFLISTMHVLIVKLRRSTSNEIKKIRKAVCAALVLLPLLGITNAFNMIEGPLDGPAWKLAIWNCTTHILRSFQGLFIAVIYCFMNTEVKMVIMQHYRNYMALRLQRLNQQMNDSSRDTGIELPIVRGRQLTGPRQQRVDMRSITNTAEVAETEFGYDSSQAAKCQKCNRESIFVARWKRNEYASDSENNRPPNAQERAGIRFAEPATISETVENEATSSHNYPEDCI